MYYNIFSSKVKHFRLNDTVLQLFAEKYQKYYVNQKSKYVALYVNDAQYMVK